MWLKESTMKTSDKILLSCVFIFLLIVSIIYFANPLGTGSADFRARVLGFMSYRIPGKSMQPTLMVGDLIFVTTGSYANKIPEINDVITFKNSNDGNADWVKRVIAREGERVTLSSAELFVDGQKVDQYYLDSQNTIRSNSESFDYEVPEGHLFVLGDNRDHSNDSRYWGFIPIENVIGKVSTIWMSEDFDRIGMKVD